MDYKRGENLATASMICGIISLVFIFFNYSTIVGMILAIIAIVLSVNAKKSGYTGGMQKAGLILGIISVALNALMFISCVICAGLFVGMLTELEDQIVNYEALLFN